MAWAEIRDAVGAMLVDAGYVVRGSKGVASTVEKYVVIVSEREGNLDTGNYAGTNQYRNQRDFTLWVYNKRDGKIGDNLDMVLQRAREECEVILQDFKRIFGSTYNKIGEAGGMILKYTGMQFKEVSVSGGYAPVRMEVTFNVQFYESRHIT